MKKLMVAACAAVLAVAANAAYVSWESCGLAALDPEVCSGQKDFDITGLGGDNMSCVKMLVWESLTQDYTDGASVWAAYQSGALKEENARPASYANVGNMGGPAVEGGTSIGGTALKDGDTVYAAVLFLHSETEDYANPDYYMANTGSALAATLGGQAINLGLVVGGGTSTTATEWAAVPEPTSGLLLLLGVAGLALRRRRA